jgi:predicted secreted acid phosphatase
MKAKNHKTPRVPMEVWKNLDDTCLHNVLDTLNEYCVNKEFDSEGWHTFLTLGSKQGDLNETLKKFMHQ